MSCRLKYFPAKPLHNPWGLKVHMVKTPVSQIMPYLKRTRLARHQARSNKRPDNNKQPFNFTVKLTPQDFAFVDQKRVVKEDDEDESPAKRGAVAMDIGPSGSTSASEPEPISKIEDNSEFDKMTIMMAVVKQNLPALHHLVTKARTHCENEADEERLAKQLSWGLMQAVGGRCPQMVEALLEWGARPFTSRTCYPLALSAIDMNCPEIVHILMRHGIDFTCTGPNGNALHSAAQCGNEEILESLVKLNLDIDQKNELKQATPLIIASEIGHLKCVEVLLKSGCQVDATDKYGRTALHHASMRGKFGLVGVLLSHGADILKVDNEARTPWMLAVQHHHNIVVHLLTSHGGMPTGHTFKGGKTYLHLAAAAGNPRCVDMLLAEHCDPKACDEEGNTPLMDAVMHRRLNTIRLLLEKTKCDINHRNKSGQAAIHKVLFDMVFDEVSKIILKLLLEKGGGDMNLVNSDGEHPLLVLNDSVRVKILTEAGANINVVSKTGQTVLSRAVERATSTDNPQEVEMMLSYNVDLRLTAIPGPSGHTPLTLALKNRSIRVATHLFHSGSSLAGLQTWLKSAEALESRSNDSQLDALCQKIEKKLYEPKSMVDLARMAVLGSIPPCSDISSALSQLELPRHIIPYLKLKVFQKYHEQSFIVDMN